MVVTYFTTISKMEVTLGSDFIFLFADICTPATGKSFLHKIQLIVGNVSN